MLDTQGSCTEPACLHLVAIIRAWHVGMCDCVTAMSSLMCQRLQCLQTLLEFLLSVGIVEAWVTSSRGTHMFKYNLKKYDLNE